MNFSYFFYLYIFLNILANSIFSIRLENSSGKHDSSYRTNWKCLGCTLLASVLRTAYFDSRSQECLTAIVAKVCSVFGIENSQVCHAISTQYKDEVLYVVGELLLNPRQFCGFMLRNCSDAYNPLNNTWIVPLPDKPYRSIETKLRQLPNPSTIRVLHLSDIHFDTRYEEGSEAECSYPLCCRNRANVEGPVKVAAGKWGHFGKCDIPLILLENLFQHLRDNEKFDYILWTGDIPPHDVWNQTRTDQLRAYDILMNMFAKYFPHTLVFSAVGNHESAPADSFPPHFATLPRKYSISWLYDALATHWTKWLPKSSRAIIRNKASYVVKLFPGLRLIAVNTNYCVSTNFWLYLNDTDPDGELSWLVNELYEAEKVGDKVHVIGHTPSGDSSCLPQWSYNYYRIINRFQDTVVGQFFGHTHTDHWEIFYEDYDPKKRATNVAYVAPSVTTFDSYMPAYRIYTIDANYTWNVLDYETYYANITDANIRNKVEWKLEYRAKEDYGMADLSAESWNKLINQSIINETLANLLTRHYFRADIACDRNCTLSILCQMRSARTGYPKLCSDLPPGYQKSRSHVKSYIPKFKETFASPFVPKECWPGKWKSRQMHPQSNSEMVERNENCVIIANECRNEKCGEICDGIVSEHSRFGQPSQLDNCRAAVCHVDSECCCARE